MRSGGTLTAAAHFQIGWFYSRIFKIQRERRFLG